MAAAKMSKLQGQVASSLAIGVSILLILQTSSPVLAPLLALKYYFVAMVGALIAVRMLVQFVIFPVVLERFYRGVDRRRAKNFCEWVFELLDSTLRTALAIWVAGGSWWVPRPLSSWTSWTSETGSQWPTPNGDFAASTSDMESASIIVIWECAADSLALACQALLSGIGVLPPWDNPNGPPTNLEVKYEAMFHHILAISTSIASIVVGVPNIAAIAVVLIGCIDICEFIGLLTLASNIQALQTSLLLPCVVLWSFGVLCMYPVTVLSPLFVETIPPHLVTVRVGLAVLYGFVWTLHLYWLYKGWSFVQRNFASNAERNLSKPKPQSRKEQ